MRNAIWLLVITAMFCPVTEAVSRKDLPAYIWINKFQWNLKIVKKLEPKLSNDTAALTDCKKHTIQIDEKLSGGEMAEAILHEVMHAFVCADGVIDNRKLNNGDWNPDDHQGIYFAAPKWADFLSQNRKLVAWLQKQQDELTDVQKFEVQMGRAD
jgi:hypothetical protein